MTGMLDSLVSAIQAGMILPGDGVLYRYAKPGWTQRMIERVQNRALADLGVGSTGDAAAAAAHTHAGMVQGAGYTVEMTSPRARLCPWPRRLRGVAEIAVVRPAGDPDPRLLRQAAAEGCEDVLHRVRYPYREIVLYYLWAWGWKKLRGRTAFSAVFRDRQRNVCSGSVIKWWQRAGVPLGLDGLDAWPESWYPARFLVDPRFRVVARFRA